MPIVQFQNQEQATLVLVIEPQGERHEIPHLGIAGVRYSLKDGAEDRCTTVMSANSIEFWCNAESCEVDIVHPEPRQRLWWDICVIGGCCGAIVDDKPTFVEDLLPASGPVTAREFAVLAVRADGWREDKPMREKQLEWLETKFIEHLGAATVDVEVLRRVTRNPFEKAQS